MKKKQYKEPELHYLGNNVYKQTYRPLLVSFPQTRSHMWCHLSTVARKLRSMALLNTPSNTRAVSEYLRKHWTDTKSHLVQVFIAHEIGQSEKQTKAIVYERRAERCSWCSYQLRLECDTYWRPSSLTALINMTRTAPHIPIYFPNINSLIISAVQDGF